MKKTLSLAAVTIVASALLMGANSATAAVPSGELPVGQALYNVDCDPAAPQLWTFSPDGASTPVGSPGVVGQCAGGGQTAPDGTTYIIFYPTFQESDLATVDLTTGAIAVVAEINGAVTDAWQLVIANDGSAFISENTHLYSIDLTTAATVDIGDMAPFQPGAMGYNPVNDTIYGFDNGNTMGVYTIDRTTGGATDTGIGGNWPSTPCLGGGSDPGSPDGVAFDANGIAWIQSDSCVSQIMAVDVIGGGSSYMTGELFDATSTIYAAAPHTYYSETFLISAAPTAVAPVAPAAPTLPDTGVDLGAAGITAGIAGLFALLGAVLVARRRTRLS